MSSLGVLLPTRNSMEYLPGHLESMQAWRDLAGEIVVVDSESTDGTVDYLRERLPEARFVTHPRGLYQSWNFGIGRMEMPWTYISTIGDGITRAGLARLLAAGERHGADVVVSPPDFVDEVGRPVRMNDWPVHDVVRTLGLREDVCFEGLGLFMVALAYLPFAILGSSASDLYRTATLKRLAFPTEYGRNGDGAWGILHALEVRLAMVPERVSFFRRHRRSYGAGEYVAPDGDARMLEEAVRILQTRMGSDSVLRVDAGEQGVAALIDAKRAVQRWRSVLQASRRSRWPWIFNPVAWRARWQRRAAQRECLELLHDWLRRKGLRAADKPLSDGRSSG